MSVSCAREYYVEGVAGPGEIRPRTLQVGTGRASPLSASAPTSSASIMSSPAAATRAETRIWPPPASPHSRAARFVTVPIAP